jgi:hypothetical protein
MDYTQYFERKTRVSNGEEFYCLRDYELNTVEGAIRKAISELLCDIHHGDFFGCFPNDWIYEMVYEAFGDLANDDIEDCSFEADCRYNDLIEWLHNPYAKEYCQEMIDEGITADRAGIFDIISAGQYEAKRRIYEHVNKWLEIVNDDNGESE